MLRRDNRPVYEILSENRASKRKAHATKNQSYTWLPSASVVSAGRRRRADGKCCQSSHWCRTKPHFKLLDPVIRTDDAHLRYRLGLNESDLRGAAAGDEETEDSDDEFVTRSFSVTPTVANIDNQITPILTDGQVRLMILGVEWFDELELTAKGVTFTVDNMDITSTERVPPQPTCRLL